jgi:hypothetical protein
MFSNFRRTLGRVHTNLGGWRSNKRIVVIESDDWGSIRMPSKKVFKTLIDKGIQVDKSSYRRFDSLESNTDLECLFNSLISYKDFKGNHPIITANTVVANPDFKKIKGCNFLNYFYEPFPETLKKYPNHDNVLNLYKEGLNDGIFIPQFHGREHVNIEMWMNLINTNRDFKIAFENKMWGLSNDIFPNLKSIQATFDSNKDKMLKESICSGLDLFEEIFGFKSNSFIANNFIWNSSLEETLAKKGVVHLQGMKYQKLPKVKNQPRKMIRHHLGEKNKHNQIYSIRNCSFEPSTDGQGFEKTIKEIESAFFWGKPAIISSHRINFIGEIVEKNREKNIIEFKKLIKTILIKWPEVEFMDTMSLDKFIRNYYE